MPANLRSLVLAATTAPALAAWPTTPDQSITIGTAEGTFFGTRQTLLTNDAGTWIAWQEAQCGDFTDGVLRLNRLDRDGNLLDHPGTAVQPDPTCAFINPPLLATVPTPTGDAVAVSRTLSDLSTEPLNAFALANSHADSQSASPQWTPGFTTPGTHTLQRIAALPGGDLIAVSIAGSTIRLDRLTPEGLPAWDQPAVLPSPSGTSLDIRAVLPADPASPETDFYLVWDAPLSYTRQAFVQRIAPTGQPRWDHPVVPMQTAPQPGISRHTPPVALTTTEGRLLYIWTQGFESATTPAPIRYQIINPDASLAFPIEGARLTDSPERQFDPVARRDESTGEVTVVFRAGLFVAQSLRAQRLSADGDRLFAAEGVDIAPIPVASPFDAQLIAGELHTLSLEATNPAIDPSTDTIVAHQLTDTQAVRGPWPVAEAPAVFSIVAAPAELGLVATWQQEGPGLDDTLHATRLNPAGRLGAGQCNRADVAAPYYILDLSDIQSFIPAFLDNTPEADLANPSGVLDLADVAAFVDAFTNGCF